jgi:hypothetical protein
VWWLGGVLPPILPLECPPKLLFFATCPIKGVAMSSFHALNDKNTLALDKKIQKKRAKTSRLAMGQGIFGFCFLQNFCWFYFPDFFSLFFFLKKKSYASIFVILGCGGNSAMPLVVKQGTLQKLKV